MRALRSVVVGLALSLVVAGAALGILTAPWFTRFLVARLDVASTASLSPQATADLAEEVRSFVARRAGGRLPFEVDGRPAFDAAAVSHLLDVRVVLVAARTLALALAAALAIWLGVGVARRQFDHVAAALRAGGAWCVALPLVAGVAGVLDFEWFFSAFHGVFFDPGTWVFPADSLLIQLFPERFWMASGGALAALVALGGAVLWLTSVGAQRAARRAASDSLQTGA